MTHIGAIIKKYRCESGLTQKDLAAGLCSPRYIYLIEKGDRTPSIFILKSLSDILKVDLFGIAYFLGYKDPVDVYETLSLFEKYRRKFDFGRLKDLTEQKEREEDFRTGPLKFEILLNRAILNLTNESKIKTAIWEFEQMSDYFSNECHFEKTYAQYLAMISMGYLMLGDCKKAEVLINNALSGIDIRKSNESKEVFHITKLVQMSIALEKQKYDQVIEEGNWLLDYQRDNSLYERMEYAYYLLALAYSKKNLSREALDCATKIVHIGLIEDISFAINQFKKNDEFMRIYLSCQRKDESMIKFMDKYHIEFGDFCIEPNSTEKDMK